MGPLEKSLIQQNFELTSTMLINYNGTQLGQADNFEVTETSI